jgi:hypothetical protein
MTTKAEHLNSCQVTTFSLSADLLIASSAVQMADIAPM